MVLRRKHFASVRINWRDKPENMMEIAKELNIGLESLVFFDDDPVERARMRQALPQVLTLEVPADSLRYAEVLLGSRAFDKLSFTDEDRQRGEMYQEQVARSRLEQSAASVEEFLKSLEMAVTIRPVDQPSFPRVLELIHKTKRLAEELKVVGFSSTLRRDGMGRTNSRRSSRIQALKYSICARPTGSATTASSAWPLCTLWRRP
jgi:FkbH-like protein